MKPLKLVLALMIVIPSSAMFAQSKGEMAFTSSSPNANKLIRSAWAAMFDHKIDEGNSYVRRVLSEDPDCGMAHASLFTRDAKERDENIRKALQARLSADEKLFIEGLRANREKKTTSDFYEPLIKKYPRDYSLQLLIMFTNSDRARAIEIGENIIKRNPKLPPVYNLLGYLYMDVDNMAKAEANFDKYISLQPKLANPYDSKGDYFMRMGKTEEAIPLYEKAGALGMILSKEKADRARALTKYPKPSDADANAIKGVLARAFAAYKNQNVDELLNLHLDQSLEIFNNQRANVGTANIRRRLSDSFRRTTILTSDFNIELIKGVGPIAIAYGTAESVVRENASERETDQKRNMIFLLRKQADGSWKIFVHHFYQLTQDDQPIADADRTSISKIFNSWEQTLKPGEILTAAHFEAFSKLYSPQAIEIFGNQVSNIGIANLRARWDNYTGTKMESNSLGLIGVEGVGRRAVAWGIGKQGFYLKGSQELQESQFPWAMILTKEKDDVWRILAMHWGE